MQVFIHKHFLSANRNLLAPSSRHLPGSSSSTLRRTAHHALHVLLPMQCLRSMQCEVCHSHTPPAEPPSPPGRQDKPLAPRWGHVSWGQSQPLAPARGLADVSGGPRAMQKLCMPCPSHGLQELGCTELMSSTKRNPRFPLWLVTRWLWHLGHFTPFQSPITMHVA